MTSAAQHRTAYRRARRLVSACPTLDPELAIATARQLGPAVDAIVDAIEAGSAALSLREVDDGVALVALLRILQPTWPLERLELTGCALGDQGLEILAAGTWPALRHLDLSHTGFTEQGARALADAAGLPRLESLRIAGLPPSSGILAVLSGSPALLPVTIDSAAEAGPAEHKPRLADPTGRAARQVALVRIESTPIDARARGLGRALAVDPSGAEAILMGLADQLDPPTQRALLDQEAFGRALAEAPDAVLDAVAAWALRLAVDAPTAVWLGSVRCALEGQVLHLQPADGALGETLYLAVEPDGYRLRKLVDGQDVLIGDAAFDRVALIYGDPAVALTLFDPPLRRWLPRWLRRGLKLENGVLEVRGGADLAWWMGEAAEAAAMVELAALAARLARPLEPLPGGLLRRLQTETDPAVVVRLAEALVAEPRVDLMMLDAAAETPIAPARRVIGASLARDLDADALRILGPAGLTAALGEAGPVWQHRLAARLAEVGDERAIPALTALAEARFGRAEVKRMARAAIEAITRRRGGLRAGGLSMAERGEAGGLSVADRGWAGGLSVTDEDG